MKINNLIVKTLPFKYFHGDLDINNDLLNKLIIWLKETNNWNYVETDFYEQYEFFFQILIYQSIYIILFQIYL